MNRGNYIEYFKNRTIDDIMEEYGEQRDEWVTLLSMDNGIVQQFRHSNGKTFFCEQIEGCAIDEKIAKTLKGKTVEQQMNFYYVTQSKKLYQTVGGEITKESLAEEAISISEYNQVISLLLKGHILVGAVIEGCFKNENLLLEKPVCTYFSSDGEESGVKLREDYVYLIFCDK